MAEFAVKETTCDKCGAEIREGALYCFGCGTKVEEESVTDAPVPNETLPPPAIKDSAAVNGSAASVAGNNRKGEELRSAASIRKRAEKVPKTPVEITWVKPSNPSPVFFIAAISLSVLTLVLLLLALYLK